MPMVCVVRFSDVYLYIHTYIHTYIYIYIYLSGIGGCSIGKPFRFVRACVRAVWLPIGIGTPCVRAGLFPFPSSFPFSVLGRRAFLFPIPRPQTSYPVLMGLPVHLYLCYGLWVVGYALCRRPPTIAHWRCCKGILAFLARSA